MTYNPDIHHRRSIRLKGYDYSKAGAYFVTMCSWQRECLFGEIDNDVMVLNECGRIVESVWCGLPEHFPNIHLDEFIIMPNHFHGIIFINESVGAMPTARPGLDVNGANIGIANEPNGGRPVGIEQQIGRPVGIAPTGPVPGSIGAIMAQFKSNVTKRINRFRNNPGCPVWQRNYFERVIRNENELSRAREYIANNPLKWSLDSENLIKST